MRWFRRWRAPREDEDALTKRADMIYQIMSFISDHRALRDRFEDHVFSSALAVPPDQARALVALAVEQGWMESAEGHLRITDYGREWEAKYWGTFR